MALEVTLEKEVRKAIENVYVKLKKGKKEAFDKVEVDDAPISSTGIFHVKLRHFDAFMNYTVFRDSETEKQKIEESYASLIGLNPDEIKTYYSIWKKTAKHMGRLGKEYGIADKLKNACGEIDINRRVRKFKQLMDIYPDKNYKIDIIRFAESYQSFLEFERTNSFVRTINNSIRDTVVDILKNPFEVYYDSEREDFVFCSDKYSIELALVLKTRKDAKENAELFTAYSEKSDSIKRWHRSAEWEKLYTRTRGCLK
jgi:hypothetical protein